MCTQTLPKPQDKLSCLDAGILPDKNPNHVTTVLRSSAVFPYFSRLPPRIASKGFVCSYNNTKRLRASRFCSLFFVFKRSFRCLTCRGVGKKKHGMKPNFTQWVSTKGKSILRWAVFTCTTGSIAVHECRLATYRSAIMMMIMMMKAFSNRRT